MDSSIQISVAIPLYNAEKYIAKSLYSVLNQDFNRPYEVVIVNDKGTDNSINIVRNICKTHPRGNIVNIIEHEKNTGVGFARNTILDNVQGKYLFFVDSDDWITEDCLSSLYEVAEKNNADITVGSVSRIDEETKNIIENNTYPNILVEHDHAGIYLQTLKIRTHVEMWNKLFRMDLLREHNIRFIHVVMEDVIWGFRAKAYAQRIAFIDKTTLFYNVREGSIMTTIQNIAHKKNVKKKKGSWDTAFVYGDIILQMQKIIKEEFPDVPGVYHYYYYQVGSCFKNFMDSIYTDDMIRLFEKTIVGYNMFVPSVRYLNNIGYKIAYLLTKVHGEDYKFTMKVINIISIISKKLKKLK